MTRHRQPTNAPLRRRVGAAITVACLGLGLTACGQPKVLTPYTPAGGVSASNQTVKINNLMLITEGDQARVSASTVSSDPDEITSISGQPLKPDDSPTDVRFRIGDVGVKLAPHTATNLTNSGIQVTSDELRPGLLASVTITFANSEPITVKVPVVSASHPDYRTAAPTPAASSSS